MFAILPGKEEEEMVAAIDFTIVSDVQDNKQTATTAAAAFHLQRRDYENLNADCLIVAKCPSTGA
jgi:hypothetical protein